MEIVINRCFGGFGLSDKAMEALISKGWGWTYADNGTEIIDLRENPEVSIVQTPENHLLSKYVFSIGDAVMDSIEFRTNPDVLAVVKELGEEANADFSKLEIVEVDEDVDVEINDFDGMEHVAESHRVWY